MSSAPLPADSIPVATKAVTVRGPRLAIPVAFLTVYWCVYLVTSLLQINGYTQFKYRLGLLFLSLIVFLVWWLGQRLISRRDRLAVLAVAIAAIVATMAFRDESIHGVLVISIVMRGVEAMLTGWTLWLLATRRSEWFTRRRGMMAIGALAWLWGLAVRMDGLQGDAGTAHFWRWTPSGEEQFLAEAAKADAKAADASIASTPLEASEGDWPEFRGPHRDGVVHGVKSLDWRESKPKEIWKRRVGPGWSSIIVVGHRLFTQEQKGEDEAVVCFDAATGDKVWSHVDKGRFDEAMGGVGPRATPTFFNGRIYALGATGMLNCLDAASGKLQWSKDVKLDGEQATPMWGFCSSPLIVDGRVIIFAGGGLDGQVAKKPDKVKSQPADAKAPVRHTLIAYDAESGELAWRAPSGTHSYSSPMLAEFAGKQQVVFMSEQAVESVDPQTGERLWALESKSKQGSPCIQPHLLGDDQILASFTADDGLMRARVKHDNGTWSTEVEWVSRDLKPFFSDFVRLGDALYGFDGSVFCCVDAETGKRHWKKGRYGSGQVLLLADQPVLFVISEAGEAVLVAANPEKHEELGKFQAIEGKTWNHPTIVGGRLYVRNAEEMACYEL